MHPWHAWRLLAACALLSVVSACLPGVTGTPSFVHLPLIVRVTTEDGVTGVARRANVLLLLTGPTEDQLLEQTSIPDKPGELSLGLLTVGGEAPPRTYYTWVFGNAPSGASRFDATLEGIGGEVVAGVFVYGMRPKSLPVDDLVWSFTDQDGAIVLHGRGLTPSE